MCLQAISWLYLVELDLEDVSISTDTDVHSPVDTTQLLSRLINNLAQSDDSSHRVDTPTNFISVSNPVTNLDLLL